MCKVLPTKKGPTVAKYIGKHWSNAVTTYDIIHPVTGAVHKVSTACRDFLLESWELLESMQKAGVQPDSIVIPQSIVEELFVSGVVELTLCRYTYRWNDLRIKVEIEKEKDAGHNPKAGEYISGFKIDQGSEFKWSDEPAAGKLAFLPPKVLCAGCGKIKCECPLCEKCDTHHQSYEQCCPF